MQGPCHSIQRCPGLPLQLSPAQTGCVGQQQCAITLTATLPSGVWSRMGSRDNDNPFACSGPYPTVLLFSGYQVASQYYKDIADRLASWGYAVVQYDRPLPPAWTPPNDQEITYPPQVSQSLPGPSLGPVVCLGCAWKLASSSSSCLPMIHPGMQILAWAAAANASAGAPFGGLFGPLAGVVGHSMGGGLAAVAAGALRPAAVILLDPVDYTQLSPRIAREGLSAYGQPALIFSVGVHCVDRTGCVPGALDHRPSPGESFGACRPGFWCCDWEQPAGGGGATGAAGGGGGMAALTSASGGASNFAALAGAGSWLVDLKRAGHMNFLTYDPTVTSE